MQKSPAETPAATQSWAGDFLPLALLAGLTINSLMVTIMTAMRNGDGFTFFLGLGPFQLATILIPASLLVRGTHRLPRAPWLEAPLALAALVPNSAVAWAALALYAGFIASRSRAEQRTGALLFVGLAAISLWSAIAMNWFAGPITAFEALMVANILAFAIPEAAWAGNVGGPTGGSQLRLARVPDQTLGNACRNNGVVIYFQICDGVFSASGRITSINSSALLHS